METWNALLTHAIYNDKETVASEELKEADTPTIISKELLSGPKAVYFELQHHAPHLKKIIDNQHSCLHEVRQKLLDVENKQEKIEDRLDLLVQLHSSLEERLQNLRSLPGLHKKPLSKSERDFKLELDKFTGVELDALHSSIEALNARLTRHAFSTDQFLKSAKTKTSKKGESDSRR